MDTLEELGQQQPSLSALLQAIVGARACKWDSCYLATMPRAMGQELTKAENLKGQAEDAYLEVSGAQCESLAAEVIELCKGDKGATIWDSNVDFKACAWKQLAKVHVLPICPGVCLEPGWISPKGAKSLFLDSDVCSPGCWAQPPCQQFVRGARAASAERPAAIPLWPHGPIPSIVWRWRPQAPRPQLNHGPSRVPPGFGQIRPRLAW